MTPPPTTVLYVDQTTGNQYDETEPNLTLLKAWGLAAPTDFASKTESFGQPSDFISFQLQDSTTTDTGLTSLDGSPILLSAAMTADNGDTYFDAVVAGGSYGGEVAFRLVYVRTLNDDGQVTSYTLYTLLYNDDAPIRHGDTNDSNDLVEMASLVSASLTTNFTLEFTDFTGIPPGQNAFGVLREPPNGPDPDNTFDVVVTSKNYNGSSWVDGTINTSNVAGVASAIGVGSQAVNNNELVIYDFVKNVATGVDTKDIATLDYDSHVLVSTAFSTVTQLNPGNVKTRADVKVWLLNVSGMAEGNTISTPEGQALRDAPFDAEDDNIGVKSASIYLNGNYETPAITVQASATPWIGIDALAGYSITFVDSGDGASDGYEYVQINGLKTGDRFEVEGDTSFDRMVVDNNTSSSNYTFDLGVTGYTIADSTTAALALGGIGIYDDGPTVTDTADADTLVLDESAAGTDPDGPGKAAAGSVSASANFADNFDSAGPTDYGTDGAGSVSYALVLDGSDVPSGLYALDPADTTASEAVDPDGIGQGAQIVLNTEAVTGDIVGTAGGTEYFRLSVDNDPTKTSFGTVTFARSNNIWHSDTTSDDDAETLSTAVGALTLEKTVVDADGDSESAAVDLTGAFSIEDDGPTVTADDTPADTLVLDESAAGTDPDGPGKAAAGSVSASANFADNFDSAGPTDYGTDGAGSVSYALVLDGSDVPSGLYALDPADTTASEAVDPDGIGQGAQIVLNTEAVTGDIVGTAGGTEYFRLSVDNDPTKTSFGTVTFARSNNIWHSDTTSDDDAETLSTAVGALTLEKTVVDADGDSESAAVDLTGAFSIEDDGPILQSALVSDPDPSTILFKSAIGGSDPSPLTGEFISWDPGSDGYGSLSVSNLQGTPPDTGGLYGYSIINPGSPTTPTSTVTINITYDADGAGTDSDPQTIAQYVFNADGYDIFATFDYQGEIEITPTELEAGAAVQPGGPHPIEFKLFDAEDLAVMVSGGTRAGTTDTDVDYFPGLLNTSAQGYASGDGDQNLEYIDATSKGVSGENDRKEAIKFTFVGYDEPASYYASLSATAAADFGTGAYDEPDVGLGVDDELSAYHPVAGFGFDFTKLTGGPKTGDFVMKVTYQWNNSDTFDYADIYYQFQGVAEDAKPGANYSKIFIGYNPDTNILTEGWGGISWIDRNTDPLLDLNSVYDNEEAPNGTWDIDVVLSETFTAWDSIIGIVAVEIENNELPSKLNAEGFNVTNPRFYSAGSQTEVVPDFNYSFDLTLLDGDQDASTMTVSTTIDGTDEGTLTTAALSPEAPLAPLAPLTTTQHLTADDAITGNAITLTTTAGTQGGSGSSTPTDPLTGLPSSVTSTTPTEATTAAALGSTVAGGTDPLSPPPTPEPPSPLGTTDPLTPPPLPISPPANEQAQRHAAPWKGEGDSFTPPANPSPGITPFEDHSRFPLTTYDPMNSGMEQLLG
ncbi:hypothetical protein KBY75_00245 [Cyanobium sp. T1G-Tous]|uniref:DUF5801 repeats-in-toxin domain-containing protein n=1 Tax=Cyanobium sp. T1G-Tous TaxID=2823722 RepID=UPI0020CC8FF2|nr:DUF5801 repeats-in-toxin domain-containing protein [Cyanobium sp. T1G-Tous]MCP9801998.1 hypothetical protein [Cyanobium sp. T1G-Tous]